MRSFHRRYFSLFVLLGSLFMVACGQGSSGEQAYKLGISEDLTTTNYWSYYGSSSDGTVWNSYVLGGAQPGLFTYSDQRFDWIPSLAADFPTSLQEETIGGDTLWTTDGISACSYY